MSEPCDCGHPDVFQAHACRKPIPDPVAAVFARADARVGRAEEWLDKQDQWGIEPKRPYSKAYIITPDDVVAFADAECASLEARCGQLIADVKGLQDGSLLRDLQAANGRLEAEVARLRAALEAIRLRHDLVAGFPAMEPTECVCLDCTAIGAALAAVQP